MEKQRQINSSTEKKSQGRIENVGSMFTMLQGKNIHVEFVLDKISYVADFPMHRMVIYNHEASGHALLHLNGEDRMLKLSVFPTSFTFHLQNGAITEKIYEKSFVKHQTKWSKGFYVKKLSTTPVNTGVYFMYPKGLACRKSANAAYYAYAYG